MPNLFRILNKSTFQTSIWEMYISVFIIAFYEECDLLLNLPILLKLMIMKKTKRQDFNHIFLVSHRDAYCICIRECHSFHQTIHINTPTDSKSLFTQFDNWSYVVFVLRSSTINVTNSFIALSRWHAYKLQTKFMTENNCQC